MKYTDYLNKYEDILPGEVYRAESGQGITFNPQGKVNYLTNSKFKAKPKDNGDLFQRFLALQNNPESLFTDTAQIPSNPEALFMNTARMPNTPFGNLSQYMGG
tara:strand:+ start:230 stop:538 length:309 start_codon:yes stop_codon:yes gene_type:complete